MALGSLLVILNLAGLVNCFWGNVAWEAEHKKLMLATLFSTSGLQVSSCQSCIWRGFDSSTRSNEYSYRRLRHNQLCSLRVSFTDVGYNENVFIWMWVLHIESIFYCHLVCCIQMIVLYGWISVNRVINLI